MICEENKCLPTMIIVFKSISYDGQIICCQEGQLTL